VSLDGDQEVDPLHRELQRPDGGTYVVRAVGAGEPLRDYGVSGTVADLLLILVEIVSVGLRHWIKPGWTVGVFLWRRHRWPRLVHKERLPPAADPAHRVAALSDQLAAGWRPRNL
jgi:hypothetical protein